MKSGEWVGQYEILERIGAGAMGEVYRAHDKKLNRAVALKILPPDLAQDPNRTSRLRREARLLAAINHPNIATIYDLVEQDGACALAMELIDGPSLDELLDRKSLSQERAIELAGQLAMALEAAHSRGIIHRDLKPANIKVTPDGALKVLDFGLGRGTGPLDGPGGTDATVTIDATRQGVIIGTPAYMSPEQARGQAVDRRTDIWAFGCILFEMLTGTSAFEGETSSDTIARVLTSEPVWETLPSHLHPNLIHLLRRCLQKDIKCRLRDVGDALLDLEDLASGAAGDGDWREPVAPPRFRARYLYALIVVVAMSLGYALARLGPGERGAAAEVLTFEVLPPDGVRIPNEAGSCFAIAPAGSPIVFVGASTEGRQLYLRRTSRIQSVPLPGTDGALAPFFSPDGNEVGFFAHGKLMRLNLRDQGVETVCEADCAHGACWTEDGTIIFASMVESCLMEVPAGGGIPRPVTEPDEDSKWREHRAPEPLPGGHHVLYVDWSAWSYVDPKIMVVDRTSGDRHLLLEDARSPVYLPTGHLVFARGAALMIQPFDPDNLHLSGEPVRLADRMHLGHSRDVAFSRSGAAVYLGGGREEAPEWDIKGRLVWVGRDGSIEPVGAEPGAFVFPSISPSGNKIAFTLFTKDHYDLWLRDLERGTTTRFTFEGKNHVAVWNPDESSIIFTSDRDGPPNLYSKPLGASGSAVRLTNAPYHQDPSSCSPDGRYLAYWNTPPETNEDILILDLLERGGPRPFAASRYNERGAVFSPNGEFIAYTCDESGRREVYVRPFQGSGDRVQVSIDGGQEPLWNPKGGELFYWALNDTVLMSVDVDLTAGFSAGSPRPLVSGKYRRWEAGIANYACAPDGDHFLMITVDEQGILEPRLTVVLNWLEEIKHRFVSS